MSRSSRMRRCTSKSYDNYCSHRTILSDRQKSTLLKGCSDSANESNLLSNLFREEVPIGKSLIILRDYNGLIDFLKERSQKGDAEAAFSLYDLCSTDDLGRKDILFARSQLEYAATIGYPDAQFNLAQYYAGAVKPSLGIPVDHKKASYWYEKYLNNQKTIDQNDVETMKRARHNLGYIYEKGFGVPKDIEKARAMYSKNCKLGLKADCARLQNIKNR